MALPTGATRAAVRTARLLPDAAVRFALPRRFGFHVAVDRPGATPAADAPVRLLIGPANFAGQGWQWARAAERCLPGVSAVSFAYAADTADTYRFRVDDRVPASVYLMSRRWQRHQRAMVAQRFTHVIVEAGRHLFGNVYGETVADEIRWLRAQGVAVAMLSHGSDMRLPERHAQQHAYSPFRDGEWAMTDVLSQEARRTQALWDEVRTPIFVSTPGMLDDVPAGRWLPVVVDADRWASDVPPGADLPWVVHAPSSAVIKGTGLIEPAVQRMVSQGLIGYERLEGVPAEEMPARFRGADIVLDQFRLGDYGVAACEAMAAGRIVVGNVDDSVRRFVEQHTGRRLPIIQADPATLEEVLRRIVADPAPAQRCAAEGPGFVRAVHGGQQSARVLAGFLGVEAAGQR